VHLLYLLYLVYKIMYQGRPFLPLAVMQQVLHLRHLPLLPQQISCEGLSSDYSCASQLL